MQKTKVQLAHCPILASLSMIVGHWQCLLKKRPKKKMVTKVQIENEYNKAELLQLNRTQFPSLGIFVSKKVGN